MSEEIKYDKSEFGGAISQSDSYSKYYNNTYEKNGSPKGFDLEKIFANPQDHIDDVFYLAKYYYAKVGIIMRVVNIVRDFGVSKYRLDFPMKEEKVKKVIKDFNKTIEIDKLLRDMIFELAQTGNLAGYDRGGKRVDIYPVTQIEVAPLVYNNKPVLFYKNPLSIDFNGMNLTKDLQKKLELTYPKEVAIGIKKNLQKIVLDVDNTFFIKVNSSRYEPYGIPFILTAFDELAHKTVLKEAERSTATGIIEKILKIGVGDEKHPPKQPEIDFYSNMFDGKKGSIRATVPYFVKPEWIEPDTDIFGSEKFEQVDTDILNALGISLTLIRGEGGGNYSEGFIAITGLIKTIENLREEIPKVIEEMYAKELKRKGLKPEHAPKFVFDKVEIDKSAKIEMLQWLFQSAGLPYEILYEELDYDFGAIKLTREKENEDKIEDTFKLREQPFQGQAGDNSKGGAKKKPVTERKTDKNQSNNKQPRPSASK